MLSPDLGAAPDQQRCPHDRHPEAYQKGGREALTEEEPGSEGNEDRREVDEQRGVGDGGEFDRPVPQAEVRREEQTRDRKADEVPVPRRAVRRRPPVPDLHPDPEDREGEGETVEGSRRRPQLAEAQEDWRERDAYSAGEQGHKGDPPHGTPCHRIPGRGFVGSARGPVLMESSSPVIILARAIHIDNRGAPWSSEPLGRTPLALHSSPSTPSPKYV